MEVLSVQNQYQGQFGVIGSTKVKDWTSPLTPPPPAPTRNRSQQRNGSGNNSIVDNNTQGGGDVVDGRQPHHYYQNQHQHHHQHHHHYKQQQQQQQAQQKHAAQLSHSASTAATAMEAATIVEGSAGARYAYNNNLLCYEPPSQAQPMPALAGDGGSSGGVIVNAAVNSLGHIGAGTVPAAFGVVGVAGGDVDDGAVEELSKRLQEELRAAKSQHLACTEVSLPWDLTPRIAAEIIKTSEREPCGVRGSTIFIEFEDEPNNTRRIASFKVDPHTVSTFELYLTLKHDKSGWTSMLRQFLKNLTRSSTILISPDFTLTKNKLYSCE